jgi:hypothetical protein
LIFFFFFGANFFVPFLGEVAFNNQLLETMEVVPVVSAAATTTMTADPWLFICIHLTVTALAADMSH